MIATATPASTRPDALRFTRLVSMLITKIAFGERTHWVGQIGGALLSFDVLDGGIVIDLLNEHAAPTGRVVGVYQVGGRFLVQAVMVELAMTRGPEAALSIALDYVAAPAWYPHAQDAHDAFAV